MCLFMLPWCLPSTEGPPCIPTALPSSREAACLPSELDLTPQQREQQPTAAKKPQAGRKRQREPSPDSEDEAEMAAVLAEMAAEAASPAAVPTGGTAGSSGRRSQRQGAGAAAGIPEDEGAGCDPACAGRTCWPGCSVACTVLVLAQQGTAPHAHASPAVDAEPVHRAGHAAALSAENAKNRDRIRKQSRCVRSLLAGVVGSLAAWGQL